MELLLRHPAKVQVQRIRELSVNALPSPRAQLEGR